MRERGPCLIPAPPPHYPFKPLRLPLRGDLYLCSQQINARPLGILLLG